MKRIGRKKRRRAKNATQRRSLTGIKPRHEYVISKKEKKKTPAPARSSAAEQRREEKKSQAEQKKKESKKTKRGQPTQTKEKIEGIPEPFFTTLKRTFNSIHSPCTTPSGVSFLFRRRVACPSLRAAAASAYLALHFWHLYNKKVSMQSLVTHNLCSPVFPPG